MINLTITDKELKATEAIKAYIEEKLTRIEKYFGEEDIIFFSLSEKELPITLFINSSLL